MSHNCFPFTSIIMKLFTKTLYELRMCPIDFGSKGQRLRLQCIDNLKYFMSNNWFLFTPFIMKLHTKAPHELRKYPIDFGVKRSNVNVTMNWFQKMSLAHYCFTFTHAILNLHTQDPYESRICPIDFGVKMSKVKVTMHSFKNWMLILVLLCENERQRWDASRYIKARSINKNNVTLFRVSTNQISVFAITQQSR